MTPTSPSTSPPGRRVGLGERLSVATLLRGYHVAPRVVHRLRPRLVAATWNRAVPWREALRENGRIILGADATECEIDEYGRGVLENMQRYMEGLVVAATNSVDSLLDRISLVEGLHDFRKIFEHQRERGIVLLSMHMGEFEPAAAYIGRHVPMHVLYHRDPIATLEGYRRRARQRLGVVEHAVDAGLGTWAELRDALGRGEAVALLGDRVQPGQVGTPIEVFGRRMELPIGPFKLAESCGSVVVPVFNWRCDDGTLAMRMGEPLDLSGGDLRRDPSGHPAVRRWASLVESMITAHPTQWLNVHPVWRASFEEPASQESLDDRSAA